VGDGVLALEFDPESVSTSLGTNPTCRLRVAPPLAPRLGELDIPRPAPSFPVRSAFDMILSIIPSTLDIPSRDAGFSPLELGLPSLEGGFEWNCGRMFWKIPDIFECLPIFQS